jgi:hypothetical protein
VPGGEPRRSRPAWLEAAAAILAALVACGAVSLGTRLAHTALLDFGPNDAGYVHGFRPDWERDGLTRFRWTGISSTVTLPFRVAGEGHRLRLRLRRHFVEPARVTFKVEGRSVAAFEVQADTKVPYRIVDVPLPRLDGRHPFVLAIEAPSDNPRPLGLALDWLELTRASNAARFLPPPSLLARASLLGLMAFLVSRLAGAPLAISLVHSLLISLSLFLGALRDPMATERILREGTPVYVFVAILVALLMRWRRCRAALGVESPAVSGVLATLTLVALGVRLTLLLHPQFYYPDVKVHGLFAWELARHGLLAFLRDFTVNQYRYSLGLQMENGHWYAFPYPPLFYALCWPVVSLAGYRPDVAVAVVAAAINSLEALVIFGIGRALLKDAAALALAAAAAHPLLPIFIARLTLAYFPALVGHAVDAVVILYLVSRLERLDRPGVVLKLGGLMGLAFLTYTQSLLNFAVLVGLFLALELLLDRNREAMRRLAGLALASALGLALASVFYGRYVPIFIDMRRGVPMPEEQVLLDKIAQQQKSAAAQDAAPADAAPDDPYAGPGVDPIRGLRKAGWRLWIFYGLFAPVVVAGILLLYARSEGPWARFVAAWALTYLVLNLASGGLPGPNLVRYNKDMEVVAPLCCVALAAVGLWLWSRARPLGALYGVSYLGFGAFRAWRYLTEKFVLER